MLITTPSNEKKTCVRFFFVYVKNKQKTFMGITTTFLEYAVLAYVMAIVITSGLYLLEHYEIRYTPTRTDDDEVTDKQAMLVYE